jgi:hypothetical protein
MNDERNLSGGEGKRIKRRLVREERDVERPAVEQREKIGEK